MDGGDEEVRMMDAARSQCNLSVSPRLQCTLLLVVQKKEHEEGSDNDEDEEEVMQKVISRVGIHPTCGYPCLT